MAPLFPVASGARWTFTRTSLSGGAARVFGLVRGLVELAHGRVAYRYLSRPTTGDAQVEALEETWLSSRGDGIWLEGGVRDGLLPHGVMLVPSEVRVGMKWRSSPGGSYQPYTFEVVSRTERATALGEHTVLWVTAQLTSEGERGVHRMYAEGFGLVGVHSEAAGPFGDEDPAVFSIAVPVGERTEAAEPGREDFITFAC